MQKAPYLFSLFNKKRQVFIDIGSESGYTYNRPIYVFYSVNMKLIKEL